MSKPAELTARSIQTPADVAAWHARSKANLKEMIEKERIPQGLIAMTPSAAIDDRFSSSWRWAEFKERGVFYGSKFSDDVAAREPFTNWTELIGLLANTIASSRALLSKMLSEAAPPGTLAVGV